MIDIAALKAIAKAATPGPRRFEVNRKRKAVELSGGSPRFDKSIMTFARYGMDRAAPVFWFWQKGENWSEKPKRADELAVAVPGREHHADWFAVIDHPDARFLETNPADVVEIIERLERAEAENAKLREALHALSMPKDIQGNKARIELAKRWGLRVPVTHSDLVTVIARAAMEGAATEKKENADG